MTTTEPAVLRVLQALVRGGALLALVSLVIEFGFPVEGDNALLHGIEIGVVPLFILEAVARWRSAPDRRAHLRRHWPGLLLMALVGVEALGFLLSDRSGVLARLYVVGVQVYLLGRMFIGVVRANERLVSRVVRPAWILVGSFLLLIGVGTGLLLLPNCRAPGVRPWSFVDALFTATSAACVTGLNVRDIGSELSFRGQAVILALIQVGGLGLVTLALFVTFLQQRVLGMRHLALARDLLSVQALENVGRFLGYVLGITLVAELTGAGILFHACEDSGLGIGDRAWWSLFHSVSAFCNAGFSLGADSFIRYRASTEVCVTLMLLIVLGGLGFPVLFDLLRFRLGSLLLIRKWRWTFRGGKEEGSSRLGVHTTLVLATTGILILGGALLFYLSEARHELAGRGGRESFLMSLFQSVTARTAGFNTVDLARLQIPSLLLLMGLMVVGASPVSTGGGVKTTGVAVLLLTVRSMMRNRETVEVLGRTIPRIVVNATVAIVTLYGLGVVIVTGLLAATQGGLRFIDLLFESISALSTVGLSTGVTARMDTVGRLVLSAAILVGRVGPLAVLWTLVSRPPALRFQYPEETIVVS